ncbi:peptidoglycan DD-metalloendopeptidase family protein [Exiguobacterium alkaliphilum]|uniref:peptidoglycan DD-metalloendopeptidase family protein n=1 Tax=Exiguobacterium alkaliphilum TaxID=1428684 RepID=UPI00403AD8E4
MLKQFMITAGVGVFILSGAQTASANDITPATLLNTTKSIEKTEQEVKQSKQAVAKAEQQIEQIEAKAETLQAEIDDVTKQIDAYRDELAPADASLFQQVLSSVLPSAKAEAAESEKQHQAILNQKATAKKTLDDLSAQQEEVTASKEETQSAYAAATEQMKAQSNKLNDLKKQHAAMAPDKFMMPANGRLSQGFGPASGQFGYTFHNGIDIAAKVGTPIYAAADGKVIEVSGRGPYGKHVKIEHNIDGQKWTTVYAHMHKIDVKKGQTVRQAEGIGQIGNTGNSSGPHLHFEVHKGSYSFSPSSAGNTVDPMKVAELLGGASAVKATY